MQNKLKTNTHYRHLCILLIYSGHTVKHGRCIKYNKKVTSGTNLVQVDQELLLRRTSSSSFSNKKFYHISQR